jgi:nucleotide-binding universal stress UspA family protein
LERQLHNTVRSDTMTFTNILFPVDFSERSRAIVPYVRAMCDRSRASLTLLHVIHVPMMAYGAADSPVVFDFPMAELKESAEKSLAELASTAFSGVNVKTLVEEGEPGSCIAEVAKARGVDLIVMPTRGHGRFRAALLGSVTAKTLHDAPCPVWTEAHCEDGAKDHVEWRNILCAIDTDGEGTQLISAAAELAASSKGTVHIVHAVASDHDATQRHGGSEFTEFLKDQARLTIHSMQKLAKTDFPVCIEAGSIPEIVRRAALNHQADLILIGRGVLPRFAGGLRSQAYAIVRDTPCPVLSVLATRTAD